MDLLVFGAVFVVWFDVQSIYMSAAFFRSRGIVYVARG